MSKSKNYTIKLSVQKDTSGIVETEKELRSLMSTLMLINIPFRIYGMLMRDNNRLQQLQGALTGDADAAMSAQAAAATTDATAISALNDELGTQVVLQGAASEGALVPAMAAGAAGAEAIVAGAAIGGALPSLQHGGMVTKTGIAQVHEGEPFGGVGGGGGDVNITNHISVDPQGMSLTDFTNSMNEQMRLALRGKTRDIPI